jgi:hypothetical protein
MGCSRPVVQCMTKITAEFSRMRAPQYTTKTPHNKKKKGGEEVKRGVGNRRGNGGGEQEQEQQE